ncbi:NAD-dependent epimerase/dehydratase family protein [Acetivibrio ethanolgignens]|uniref:Epimerase n=1 Tax=Acetivibrio ethanolgignens TaxID=290052 RepID=A0A0V8QAB1_9FIRM|nr:NAD(P)-dependent oxidoreductase [Acetivibrio ethanolgignens]KSV57509.1 epimerase [Acetivibrio ethanolgignens]
MNTIKKAVITGATGAVGISLIKELINQGIQVTAICHKNSKRIINIPDSSLVQIIECNMDEYSILKCTLNDTFDAFFHLAWDGTYGKYRDDLQIQLLNVKYTLDAVSLAKTLGCKVFIGAGSQSEYGHVEGVITSTTPCNPDNGYGIAKLAAGQMSRIKCNELGIRHIWCRIISLYGPYDGNQTMVMSLIKQLLNNERPKCTYGNQIWDYIYNKDAARALRFMAENGKNNEIYCLGSGKSRFLKDYILDIKDAINPNAQIGFGEIDYYPHQVMHLEVDISNLKKDVGFEPKYTFLQGIRETVDWYKEHIL